MAAGVSATPAVACRGLSVRHGDVVALDHLDLAVERGETVAVLGPSGAGKTTLLHAVAGFVPLSAGSVHIDGEEVGSPARVVPPERRRVGVVFQQYALWPHMTAVATVAYPLRRRGLDARDATRTALDLLDRMGVAALADRRPAEMSGGQQQRVGVARALARDAVVYLFDEPTAHLDTPLRATLQQEMAQRQGATGAAAVYATHDAGEALAVADRVVLLRDGRAVQVGTPEEVYARPVDLWAARLTGPASLLGTPVRSTSDGMVRLRVGDREVTVPGGAAATQSERPLVRPDWLSLGGDLPGSVAAAWYRGPHTDYRLDTPVGTIDLRAPGPPRWKPGEACGWDLERVWVV
jgi:ABC-type Fe3+/spermidine/putrescine transport system ATPase subunit